MTNDEEKDKVLTAFFASDFNYKASCPRGTHTPKLEDGDGE